MFVTTFSLMVKIIKTRTFMSFYEHPVKHSIWWNAFMLHYEFWNEQVPTLWFVWNIMAYSVSRLLIYFLMSIVVQFSWSVAKPYTSRTRISKSPLGHSGGLLKVMQWSVFPNLIFSSIQIACPSLKIRYCKINNWVSL